ncbi:acyltransferase [Nitrospira defluvii]|nr:acyltransferase [Nitrospira defluvii]
MKVGIVQIDSVFGQLEKNVDKAVALIESHSADLWVLPELFNTGYQFISKQEAKAFSEPIPLGPTSQRLIRTAKKQKTFIVAGIAERSGNKVYNAAALIGPLGFISVYRKIHLFYEEKRWFTPGNLPFKIDSIFYKSPKGGRLTARIGTMICFDWIFPESARTLSTLGADIICHPSNLVLSHCPDAMITRCLENRVFAITANRVGSEKRRNERLTYIGKSQIVNPRGNVLFRASEKEEAVQVVEIDPKEARDKRLNRYNHLLKDRRKRFYRQPVQLGK